MCLSSVDESHTVVRVCPRRGPSIRLSRVTIDVSLDGWIDSIREALARRRPVPRGDSWCWIPKPYYYIPARCARRAEVETKVYDSACGAASRRFFGGVFSPPRRARRNGMGERVRENVRFDGESRVEGRASIDRSRARAFGRSSGGARSTDGGAAAAGVSVRVPLGRTRRCRSRVESSRVDGWDERERIANARRRGASTSRDAVPDRESD